MISFWSNFSFFFAALIINNPFNIISAYPIKEIHKTLTLNKKSLLPVSISSDETAYFCVTLWTFGWCPSYSLFLDLILDIVVFAKWSALDVCSWAFRLVYYVFPILIFIYIFLPLCKVLFTHLPRYYSLWKSPAAGIDFSDMSEYLYGRTRLL